MANGLIENWDNDRFYKDALEIIRKRARESARLLKAQESRATKNGMKLLRGGAEQTGADEPYMDVIRRWSRTLGWVREHGGNTARVSEITGPEVARKPPTPSANSPALIAELATHIASLWAQANGIGQGNQILLPQNVKPGRKS